MSPLRKALYAVLAIFAPIHAWLACGWISKHGFWGAVIYWLKSAELDPIYATAVVDFLTVIALIGMWFLHDFRTRGGKIGPKFALWTSFFLIWPSLGIPTYFLWVRPGNRNQL